jgi:hypothetical protein
MGYLREFFGFPEESKANAHNAIYDVVDTANIFVRFMKYQRKLNSKTNFEKSFADTPMDITI